MVDGRDIEILDVFGHAVCHIFALGGGDNCANLMFWITTVLLLSVAGLDAA
jgi:hypothetical protein